MPQDTPTGGPGEEHPRLWPPQPARAREAQPDDPPASDDTTDVRPNRAAAASPLEPESTHPEPDPTLPELVEGHESDAAPPEPVEGPEPDAAPVTPRFRRTAALTAIGTVVPGLGLLLGRRRRSGAIVLGVFVLLLALAGGWVVLHRHNLIGAAASPTLLARVSVALVVLAVLWVGMIVFTHLSVRGARPAKRQRVLGALLVGVLAFAVAAPMAVAARVSYDSADVVGSVFKKQGDGTSATRPTISAPTNKADPWADIPRLNVLLLGGDAGADRTGTRTDTVIVASIDTHTGDTTLISLPRNTANMPFPSSSPLHRYYPNGFGDGNGDDAEYFLNAMYDNVPANVPKDVIGKTDNLGADVLKISVGEATGLKIDYYALINFKGFRKLVNALGGITVNINTRVAVGGNTDLNIPPDRWLEPGPNQHLDGTDALWFARGRYGADDFQRMDRQRCVINAIIDQANPANLLARYEKIAAAGKDIVQTDIPQEVLPMMLQLGTRVKTGNVRSVVFKNGVKGFVSYDPDFAAMRTRVAKSLTETKGNASGKKTGSSSGSSGKKQSENATDACAYNPS